MTTATDTFRQHLQETQAIHFLPYVGDGYADARPRILMIGEANHGTAPDGADRTYTDGVVRRALQDAAEGNGNHWVRYIRNISAMLTGNAYGGSNAVWDTVAYGVFFRKRTATGPAPRLKKSRSDAGRSLPCSTS